ncbi:YunC family protein [Methanohalophilus halophilus]|uniref:DUF1805 domain-containing protein n=1 Tax=Methanohalophilus halophilus TaxID=2177 RepID=A0A1L3Q169_9EURY|nr:DUF1805 domain-containing protein [Methanohalophilus halophilus]APH38609.1 hypothetical protein BHR79_03310 [Methanohalophilus halophilus]RNI08392.1 DUF1805 domain-containing protein [Methanohalophilus halophilus]SDW16815.1 Uncharacterized protein YunC, DUF1805 family [Methanohalophilus halophilus]
MIIEQIKLENGTAQGLKWELENASLLLIKADMGYVMCGYLNMETADKLEDVAAVVSGVDSFEDVLQAPVKSVSKKALDVGIEEGMTGRQVLEKMF